MRILLCSAGRRVYLVRWFKEALSRAGYDPQVLVTDSDPDAAACAAATTAHIVPPYSHPEYRHELLKVIRTCRPDLVLSLNDYELDIFSSGLGDEIRALGTVVLTLASDAQAHVADKYLMAQAFDAAGIPTPITALASDRDSTNEICNISPDLVVKDRFGSGSSGLELLQAKDLPPYLLDIQAQHGKRHLDDLIVQPRMQGEEIGMDVVTSLDGKSLAGVLTRRKIAMKGGETNTAETLDASPYRVIAKKIVKELQPCGLIDVDLVLDSDGSYKVLDINPRFGGGYPFCHIAGADVPAFYVAELEGQPPPPAWDIYEIGVRSTKYIDIVPFESNSR